MTESWRDRIIEAEIADDFEGADKPWEPWLDREIVRAGDDALLSRLSQKSLADSRFEVA